MSVEARHFELSLNQEIETSRRRLQQMANWSEEYRGTRDYKPLISECIRNLTQSVFHKVVESNDALSRHEVASQALLTFVKEITAIVGELVRRSSLSLMRHSEAHDFVLQLRTDLATASEIALLACQMKKSPRKKSASPMKGSKSQPAQETVRAAIRALWPDERPKTLGIKQMHTALGEWCKTQNPPLRVPGRRTLEKIISEPWIS